MSYLAAIDIGTHSALLLIAQRTDGQLQPLLDVARTTKLGETLASTKQISPAALDRLLGVLNIYQAMLSEYPLQRLVVFGTAAFRLATNTDACRRAIADQLGWPLQVLSGPAEADYTFRGIVQLLPPPSALASESRPPVLAIDIGGGSTEVISGVPGCIHHQWSIPIGAVLLQQQFHPGDCLSGFTIQQMEQFLANHFAPIQLPETPRQVFVTGGTATTLATLLQELREYNFRRIDGYRCSLDSIDMVFQELNRLTTAQRADLAGMEAGRADVILPALVILRMLLGKFQTRTITITIRGARYGILAGD
jgi:exopolyphosphatase/guanosine-5'-triphosphate,3'-diphosphate pyrophosphatase